MCFSAPVSFASAFFIGGVGLMTLRNVPEKSYLPLACIPFGLAAQQLIEGLLWLALAEENSLVPGALIAPLGVLYIFFALLAWPVWTPLALAIVEKKPTRQAILGLFVLGGLAWGGFFIFERWHLPLTVEIEKHSLHYSTGIMPVDIYPYALLSVTPFFISTLPWMMAIGSAIAICGALASFFYWHAFISVWCFGAAAISLGFYFVFHTLAKERQEEASLQ